MANKSEILAVKIISPEKVYFDGSAYAVASHNNEGPFSIIYGHASFISLISGEIVVYLTTSESSKQAFTVKKAVLHCKDNTVKIMIGLYD